jgi:hypothetical protein
LDGQGLLVSKDIAGMNPDEDRRRTVLPEDRTVRRRWRSMLPLFGRHEINVSWRDICFQDTSVRDTMSIGVKPGRRCAAA